MAKTIKHRTRSTSRKAFITVLIADSHRLLRRGMRAIIDEQTGMEVVGETDDGRAAGEMIKGLKPDVVLMDGVLPGCSECECAARIADAGRAKVVILSSLPNINCAHRMLELGASGYLLKDCEPDEVASAVRTVCDGQVYLSKRLSRQLPRSCAPGQPGSPVSRAKRLSPRESEVVSLIAAGHSTDEIVQSLGIRLTTLRTYRKRIREKLGVHSDVELTKFAIRNGLASLD